MTVHEFLTACGRCPECGHDILLTSVTNDEAKSIVEGRCRSHYCDSTWRFEIKIEET